MSFRPDERRGGPKVKPKLWPALTSTSVTEIRDLQKRTSRKGQLRIAPQSSPPSTVIPSENQLKLQALHDLST